MKKIQANPDTLAKLYGMINSGQASQALLGIQELLIRTPEDSNALHLAALAHAVMGNSSEAQRFFAQTLKVNPRQPEVHNNFANFLKLHNQPKQAKPHYLHATALIPKFGDAWRNLAILEYEQNELESALSHARRASEITPNHFPTLTLLGNICRKSDRLDIALDYFKRAIALKPDHVNAIYGLANTYSALEQSDKALPLLEQALNIKPDSAEVQYSLALALLSLGEYKRAEATLQSLLHHHPLYVEAHRTLNEIYWQQGDKTAFCQSYRTLPKQQRQDVSIAIAHVENLLASNQPEEAERLLTSHWQDCIDPRIVFLRGRIAEEQGDTNIAATLYEQVFTQHPELSVAKQFFIALIKTGQFDRAEKLIENYLDRATDDQLLWAQLGTCWKMTGNERYHWLVRENTFVQRFEIPTPEGFGNRDEFLKQLEQTLVRMHNLKVHPLNQSVRSGVQTPGRLLHKRDPLIQALRSSLAEVVTQYIAAMPTDDRHPLLRRKSADFTFSGSWSVMLKGGGHHVSHVHPQGWISSAFYVSVPPRQTGETLAGGDIYFGQSPYQLGSKDAIEKYFAPEAGTLVLFPAYTWHGTVPLPADNPAVRITAPFDAVPLPPRI